MPITATGPPSKPDPAAAGALLRRWLARAATDDALAWLDAEISRQRSGVDERKLVMALGMAGRKIGRRELALPASEQQAAHALRSGWQPGRWGADEAARAAILLATYAGDQAAFAARVDRLCAGAELSELIAILKAFAVFPAAERLHERAREAVRSSVKPVFEAIACHNPYPFDYFEPAAFNQMVVKAVFVGASIGDIVGLAARRNPELQEMLGALASERVAAGRAVPADVTQFLA